jgi:hypothetical protein
MVIILSLAFGVACFVAGVLVERKNAAILEPVVDEAKKDIGA